MATVSRGLPERPHLDVPKREARELLEQWRDGDPTARERVFHRHPKLQKLTDEAAAAATEIKLTDAQLVVAREYGFSSWPELKRRIESNAEAVALQRAIRADDRETVVRILRTNSALLHVPLRSGNWGPPMSHAANLGRLELIETIALLGAKDYQHAFDRALLQGQIECARWLHARGATLAPGIVMGSCETLNAAGFRFLLELGAPLTDAHGDRLAPLSRLLGTYSRNPAGKHEILELFAAHGYALPDTPVMALHRGDLIRLEDWLRRDPQLLKRRFALREIYPAECGCPDDGGMHLTPIAGTTLLHLAIDFREREVFDWLLAHGADPNARAEIDAYGFGGHTPLFNAAVNGPWRDPGFIPGLLERGADRAARASLRKFLDWQERPAWHTARDVTPAEWARGFPDSGWVTPDATKLL